MDVKKSAVHIKFPLIFIVGNITKGEIFVASPINTAETRNEIDGSTKTSISYEISSNFHIMWL